MGGGGYVEAPFLMNHVIINFLVGGNTWVRSSPFRYVS